MACRILIDVSPRESSGVSNLEAVLRRKDRGNTVFTAIGSGTVVPETPEGFFGGRNGCRDPAPTWDPSPIPASDRTKDSITAGSGPAGVPVLSSPVEPARPDEI
jgi:hypothetical protein